MRTRTWHVLDVVTVTEIVLVIGYLVCASVNAALIRNRMAATDRQIQAVLRTMTPE